MTISESQRHKRRNRVGYGFKATIVGLSLMSLLVAWDLGARRDAAKALADTGPLAISPTPVLLPTATPWPTLSPPPTLTPPPTLAPLPTLAPVPEEMLASTGATAGKAAAISVSIAPPPSLSVMPTMAPLPEMPAPPPPPPPPSKGGGGGGGGGGSSRSKGS